MKRTKIYIAFCSLLLSMWLVFCIPVGAFASSQALSMLDVGDKWQSKVYVPKISSGVVTSYVSYTQDADVIKTYDFGSGFGEYYSIQRKWTGFIEPTDDNRTLYFDNLHFKFGILVSDLYDYVGAFDSLYLNLYIAIDIHDKNNNDYTIPNTYDYPYRSAWYLGTTLFDDESAIYRTDYEGMSWIPNATNDNAISLWQTSLSVDNVGITDRTDTLYLWLSIRGVSEQYEGVSSEYIILPKTYYIDVAMHDGELIADESTDPWVNWTTPVVTDNPYIDDVVSRWDALTLPNLSDQTINIGNFFAQTLLAIWEWDVVKYICIPIGCTSISFYICKMVFFRR